MKGALLPADEGHVVDALQPRMACLMGIPVHVVDRKGCVDLLVHYRNHRIPCFLTTPNVNFVATALLDRDFRDSICRSDVSVVDGMPLLWVARLLGIPLRERVSGSDLFEDLAKSAGVWRTFFVGGPEGVAQKACSRLSETENSIEPVGFFYPGFASLDQMPNDKIITAVHGAKPDLLILALGAVKGQAWICRHLDALPPCVVSHLGAVVNFAAGEVLRAPVWIQRSGLEWVWRIKEEPGLWRRYWKDGLSFLAFFVLRTLPLALASWCERLVSAAMPWQGRECRLLVHVRQDGCFVLSGDCVDGQFDDLVKAVHERSVLGLDVFMDLSAVRRIDPFFAGFLMVTESRLRRCGQRLVLSRVGRRLRRRFHWMGASDLLEKN